MSCERYLDLISTRLDGELTAQEEADLTAHLQRCPACRAIAQDMQTLHSSLAELGEVDAPAELFQGVISKIRAEKRQARRRLVHQLSGLAACLVLCVGVLRVADATYSEYNRHAADPNLPSVARHTEPQPVALNRLDAYALPDPAGASVAPFAHLLDSVDALNRFLARLPQTDFSTVTNTYNEDFFLSNRLVAIVLQEPSTSITHRVTELTEDRAVVLRDVPEAGDCAMALWLLLGPTELAGPERPLALEITNG